METRTKDKYFEKLRELAVSVYVSSINESILDMGMLGARAKQILDEIASDVHGEAKEEAK